MLNSPNIVSETLTLLEWPRLCEHLATFTQTPLGEIAAHHLLPATTQSESQRLLAETQEVEQIEADLESQLQFKGITDLTAAFERVAIGGILSGSELLAIAALLVVVRQLRRVIENRDKAPVLQQLVADIRTFPELERQLYHCLDEDGKVAERASPKLGEIRQKLKGTRAQIQQKLQRLVQIHGSALQETVITQRGDRFVLPVKAPQKDLIPGIIHDTSATGNTLYIEPNRVVELGNRLRQAQRQEKTEEEKIFRQLSQEVEAVLPELETLLVVATQLDLATARLRYSLWLGGNPPTWVSWQTQQAIQLRHLRHPLLFWQQQKQDGNSVVPISLTITPATRVIAITGPNTGGKTVTLKTLGLAALMAKAGLYVPAKDPVELPWFSQILADIGDEQSLQQNLSTFSGHITRIIRILQALPSTTSADHRVQECTHNPPDGTSGDERLSLTLPTGVSENHKRPELTDSNPTSPAQFPALVLLDEVGAGTDPIEGSALAIALLQHLAEQNCLTIATTHYGELKALKYQDSRFENASVEFNDQTLSPTYRLLWGIPGRSNALTIAQCLGLSGTIVSQAKAKLGGFTADVNEVIAGLEAQRREQENKAQDAQKLLQETEAFYDQVSQKAAQLKARERDLRAYQEQEVQAAITDAKAEIAKVIRQLQRGKPSGQKAQQATAALEHIQQKQTTVIPPSLRYRPQKGERIRIPRLGQTAEVTQVNLPEETVNITLGLMKMTIPFQDLESLDGKKVQLTPKPSSKPVATNASKSQTTSQTKSPPTPLIRTERNTLDCRGDRIERAESRLEPALNQALEAGVLWIIHGKGTGRLRQGVHDFLDHHPLVKRYELAPSQEGGAGVTIAYLH